MSDPSAHSTDDASIRALLVRLARPRAGGGHIIERAQILAAGADSAEIEAWIVAHAGTPERLESRTAHGLHGDQGDGPAAADRATRRFVIPDGVL
jgi:hypothetical protein